MESLPVSRFPSSREGINQILFRRGTQHFPVLQPPGSTEASLRASELKLGVVERGNASPSAKRYLINPLSTTNCYFFLERKREPLLACDIDNNETDKIKTTEYDLDHNLLIKDINNIMLK